ncbi:hypothetical protein ABPG75_007013 [Micractinium tetrahymenae]
MHREHCASSPAQVPRIGGPSPSARGSFAVSTQLNKTKGASLTTRQYQETSLAARMTLTEQRLTAAAGLAAAAGLGLVIGRLSWRADSRKPELPPLPPPPLLLPAGGAAEEAPGPTLDLPGLSELGAAPERFYLPDGSLAALADSFAVVDGTRWPLHSQVLSTQSAVLRDLFVSARSEGGVGAQAMPDLSAAFEGSSLEDAALLLRLVYSPDEACASSFAALAASGRLEGVARLADKLDTPRLLRSLERYLTGLAGRLAAERGGLQELLAALRVALACRFDAAQDSCLEGLADHIAAAGSCWPPGLAEVLQGLDSAVLTQLLRKTGRRALGSIYRPSPLFDVRPVATGDATGGFTYCLQAFSTHHDTGPGGIYSPWAEVEGFRWRLNVYPDGKGESKGTHLAVFLYLDAIHAEQSKGVVGVTCHFRTWVVDQRGAAGQDHEVASTNPDTFTLEADNWGRTRFMPLAELRRRDRAYLAHDRLILRVELRILGTRAAAAEED